MATMGGNLLQRTRYGYFRDTGFACNKREPGSGCPAIHGENRTHAILGVSNSCIATNPGDMAVALTVLDAQVELTGRNGKRTVAIGDFYRVRANEKAVAAALQHPQTPLRRAVGSSDPFTLQPIRLPKVPEIKKVRPAKAAKLSSAMRPLPDRSELDAAEKALRDLDEERKKEEADFRRKAEALEAKRSAAQEAYVSRRKWAAAAVSAARDAYRKAGGTV